MIHGIWLGSETRRDVHDAKDMPELQQACVRTWPKGKRIFETSWHVREAAPVLADIPYWEQALDARHWAGASDVARLALLWHHGGIYLDTDVEVLRKEKLLGLQWIAFTHGSCYVGEETEGGDICGAVIIAPPQHPMIARMLHVYAGTNFKDTFNGLVNGTTLLTREIRTWGAATRVLPPHVFYPWHHQDQPIPTTLLETPEYHTTIAAHHWAGQWENK